MTLTQQIKRDSPHWKLGWEIGRSGKGTEDANPYERGTSRRAAWWRGFIAGRKEAIGDDYGASE